MKGNAMAKRRKNRGKNPLAVLATSITAQDNMRVGITVAPRKVVVTERVSISRVFTAPRLDMGEYSPVPTHVRQIQDLSSKDYNYSVA